MSNAKKCREERAEVISQLEAIVNKAKAEKRSLNTDETATFDRLDSVAKELNEKAEGFERIENFEGMTVAEARSAIRADAVQTPKRFSTVEDRNNAYKGWFYHGSRAQRKEYWQASERHGIDVSNPHLRFDWNLADKRSQTLSPGSAGGDVVAVDNSLMREIDIALKAFGGVREVSTVVRTSTGSNLPWPTSSDVDNLAEQTAEASAINDIDMTFGQNVLSSYKYDTGFIKVSWELLTDSIIDLAALIGRQGGIRLGRKLNALFTTGTGSSMPQGVVTGATKGKDATNATSIIFTDLTGLYHSVDPLYRDSPNCVWMFSDGTLQKLREIVDGNQRPILMGSLEGINVGLPATLMGKRYVINQQMATVATGNKSVLFGDFSKFIIRDVNGEDGGFNLMRLNERFADTGLVAWLGWSRHDSLLSDAGTHPIKYLLHP